MSLRRPERHDSSSSDVKSLKDATVATHELPRNDVVHQASAVYGLDTNPFDNEKFSKHYEPVHNFEGIHRFDPKFEWTKEEEKKLVRRLDWKVVSWVCLMFACLQLDRTNINNALTDNFLNDLHLTTNDYNTGQTLFYVCFLAAELPAQLISKRIGPDRWIPIQIVAWSIVAICQCRITNKTGFFLTRAFLGAAEGGFIPDIILYMSYFYTIEELPMRLSWFYVQLTSTTIIGSFVAFGVLRMRGIHGWAGWQYLFLIEGLFTLAVGVVSWFYLPPGPYQTKGWLRGKNGWFNEREESIMANRILRDDPSKGDLHNRQQVGFRDFFRSLSDYDLWPNYVITLTSGVAPQTVTAYLGLTLRQLGFSTFNSNLLIIPSGVIFILMNLGITRIAQLTKQRAWLVLITPVYVLILLIPLAVLPATSNRWIKYAITTLIVGYPFTAPIILGWVSANSGSVRSRAISGALCNMNGQLGGIIASNVYRQSDMPLYRRGNRVLIGISSWNIVLILATKIYFIKRNQYKQKKWDALSEQEKLHYLETTTDKGNRRLDFRFVH